MSVGTSQQFCVRWNSHLGSLGAAFPQLLADQRFVDVTLACEGHQLHCHRLVLAACSTYFESLLGEYPCKHPIIILPRDIKLWEIQALVDFMYKGEVNVSQAGLADLLKCAEILQIRGLYGSDVAFNLNHLTNSTTSSSSSALATASQSSSTSTSSTTTAAASSTTAPAVVSSSGVAVSSSASVSPSSPLSSSTAAQAASTALLTLSTAGTTNTISTTAQSTTNLPNSVDNSVNNNDNISNNNSNNKNDNTNITSNSSNTNNNVRNTPTTSAQTMIQADQRTVSNDNFDDTNENICENSNNTFGNSSKITSTPNQCSKIEPEDYVQYDDVDYDDSINRLSTDGINSEDENGTKYSLRMDGLGKRRGDDRSMSMGYVQGGFQINMDNMPSRRVRRSEALLRQAAECVSRGQTFQTVSDMFNIPISTIRFFMARKGILPRRKRGRSAGVSVIGRRTPNENLTNVNNTSNPGISDSISLLNRSGSPSEPPFHFANYKLPEIKPKLL